MIQFFSYINISWWEQVTCLRKDDDVCFIQYQYAKLFFWGCSLTVTIHRHIFKTILSQLVFVLKSVLLQCNLLHVLLMWVFSITRRLSSVLSPFLSVVFNFFHILLQVSGTHTVLCSFYVKGMLELQAFNATFNSISFIF
jgi:hypothetical protein